MNAHSLRVLEFGEIVSMLRERTACALGDEVAQHLEPTADLLTITESQRETTEAARIISEEGAIPLGGIHDIRSPVTKAGLEALLDPADLLKIMGTLASGRKLRAFIIKRSENCPKLTEIAANIHEFARIEASIADSINDNGEIRDTASPELASVRSKLKTTHSRLMDKLHSIIHSAEYRTMIQDPVITQRGDRYCIPIKAEHRPHFPGIVHDSSASGATVFIEPASVVDKGNDLRELALKEEHEIEKILKRLSGMVKASATEICITLDALARLDFIHAKGRLSCEMDAVEPRLNRNGEVNIIEARHPLLKGEVVPIDVELGSRFEALLITGPNTGGKTVTLKTIGLLSLMAQSGLHIPAKFESETAVFDQVYADIGDEQSIQQSLSTFSSHMTNIVNIIGGLGKNSLVLLDEIGAGTDPAEGAALAKAILDHLVANGARAVATTHYGELKDFAFVREGLENASVEFSIETLEPTYRLMIGVPGSSNAFAIASRLGLPARIVESAREMMSGRDASEEIIRKIEQTHRAATEREQLAQRTSRDVDQLKTHYQQRIEEMEVLRREIRRQLTEEVDRRVQEKLDLLNLVIEDLKKQPVQAEKPAKRIQEAKQSAKEVVEEIREEVEQILPPVYDKPDEPFVLRKGDQVTVKTFNVDGELLNDPEDGGEAHVMVGSVKVNLPFADLRPARKPRAKEKSAVEASKIASSKAVAISPEINLRALRAEAAIEKLDKYLDDACLAGLPSVRIIHGKGTGALKKAVWEYLSNHPEVAAYRHAAPNEGGEGATIVEIRNPKSEIRKNRKS